MEHAPVNRGVEVLTGMLLDVCTIDLLVECYCPLSLSASGVATPGPIRGLGPGEFLTALVNHLMSTYLNPVA